jgi:hypothetical protein
MPTARESLAKVLAKFNALLNGFQCKTPMYAKRTTRQVYDNLGIDSVVLLTSEDLCKYVPNVTVAQYGRILKHCKWVRASGRKEDVALQFLDDVFAGTCECPAWLDLGVTADDYRSFMSDQVYSGLDVGDISLDDLAKIESLLDDAPSSTAVVCAYCGGQGCVMCKACPDCGQLGHASCDTEGQEARRAEKKEEASKKKKGKAPDKDYLPIHEIEIELEFCRVCFTEYPKEKKKGCPACGEGNKEKDTACWACGGKKNKDSGCAACGGKKEKMKTGIEVDVSKLPDAADLYPDMGKLLKGGASSEQSGKPSEQPTSLASGDNDYAVLFEALYTLAAEMEKAGTDAPADKVIEWHCKFWKQLADANLKMPGSYARRWFGCLVTYLEYEALGYKHDDKDIVEAAHHTANEWTRSSANLKEHHKDHAALDDALQKFVTEYLDAVRSKNIEKKRLVLSSLWHECALLLESTYETADNPVVCFSYDVATRQSMSFGSAGFWHKWFGFGKPRTKNLPSDMIKQIKKDVAINQSPLRKLLEAQYERRDVEKMLARILDPLYGLFDAMAAAKKRPVPLKNYKAIFGGSGHAADGTSHGRAEMASGPPVPPPPGSPTPVPKAPPLPTARAPPKQKMGNALLTAITTAQEKLTEPKAVAEKPVEEEGGLLGALKTAIDKRRQAFEDDAGEEDAQDDDWDDNNNQTTTEPAPVKQKTDTTTKTAVEASPQQQQQQTDAIIAEAEQLNSINEKLDQTQEQMSENETALNNLNQQLDATSQDTSPEGVQNTQNIKTAIENINEKQAALTVEAGNLTTDLGRRSEKVVTTLENAGVNPQIVTVARKTIVENIEQELEQTSHILDKPKVCALDEKYYTGTSGDDPLPACVGISVNFSYEEPISNAIGPVLESLDVSTIGNIMTTLEEIIYWTWALGGDHWYFPRLVFTKGVFSKEYRLESEADWNNRRFKSKDHTTAQEMAAFLNNQTTRYTYDADLSPLMHRGLLLFYFVITKSMTHHKDYDLSDPKVMKEKFLPTQIDEIAAYLKAHGVTNAPNTFDELLRDMMQFGLFLWEKYYRIPAKGESGPMIAKRLRAASIEKEKNAGCVTVCPIKLKATMHAVQKDIDAAWDKDVAAATMKDLLWCRRNIRVWRLGVFMDGNVMERLLAKTDACGGIYGKTVSLDFHITEETELCLQFLCGLCDYIVRKCTPDCMLPLDDDPCWAKYGYDRAQAWSRFTTVFYTMQRTARASAPMDWWITRRQMVLYMRNDPVCGYDDGLLLCFARLIRCSIYFMVVRPLHVAKDLVVKAAKAGAQVVKDVLCPAAPSSTPQNFCVQPVQALGCNVPVPFGMCASRNETTHFCRAVQQHYNKSTKECQLLLVCDQAFSPGTPLYEQYNRSSQQRQRAFVWSHVLVPSGCGYMSASNKRIDPLEVTGLRVRPFRVPLNQRGTQIVLSGPLCPV